MAGVRAELSVRLSGKQTGTNDIGLPALPFTIDELIQFDPGTATTGQANTLFLDERTLASSATENLDLAGVLTDAFGATIADAEVVAIYLKADAANTVPLVFFGAAANAFNGPLSGTTPKMTLQPGEFVVLSSKAGWPVTAGTGDIVLVANGAASSKYRVGIIGRTVAA